MQQVLNRARSEAQGLVPKAPREDTPWRPLDILVAAAGPLPLFAYVYYISACGLQLKHYWSAVALGPLAGFAVCVFATVAAASRLGRGAPARGPIALAAGLWVAAAAGLGGGRRNFSAYLRSYHLLHELAAYTDVDPGAGRGRAYMDSGLVYFREGAAVERRVLASFKSERVYCAAPIVAEPSWDERGKFYMQEGGRVDFWAVGVDCCDQAAGTFGCSAGHGRAARAGVRVVRDDLQAYFALAVRAWGARNCPAGALPDAGPRAAPVRRPEEERPPTPACLHAQDPLFFYWVEDPLLEVDEYYAMSLRMFGAHFGVFLLVAALQGPVLLRVLFELKVR